MRFVQTSPDAPARPGRARGLKPALRLATVVYWGAGLLLGLAHLRRGAFSEEAWGATLTVWYAEALIFLAAFGGVAMVAGFFARREPSRPRRPPRLSDPLKTSPLAGVERGRSR